MSYVAPNFAVIPTRILYLEGVQLSYIKVYTEIFHLWQCHKPCFMSNAEFCKRTKLSDRTIRQALLFFEQCSEIRRVEKNGKRYIMQEVRGIEIEQEPVDNSDNSSENSGQKEFKNQGGGELTRRGGGANSPTYNKNLNKSKKNSSSIDTYSKERDENTAIYNFDTDIFAEVQKEPITHLTTLTTAQQSTTNFLLNLKTSETEGMCYSKKLDINIEIKKFTDYYQKSGGEITYTKFVRWLHTAKTGTGQLYTERNTMTAEYKNAKKGSHEAYKNAMLLLPKNVMPGRIKEEINELDADKQRALDS